MQNMCVNKYLYPIHKRMTSIRELFPNKLKLFPVGTLQYTAERRRISEVRIEMLSLNLISSFITISKGESTTRDKVAVLRRKCQPKSVLLVL